MERWVPLFDIFLNSPTPETDASRWLLESFTASSAAPITTASFLSLLAEPQTAIVSDSSPFSPTNTRPRRVTFMETLPSPVQSRILSFLAVEHQRFCSRDLLKLAGRVLRSDSVDFWVERAARHLFDVLSQSNSPRVHSLGLDLEEEVTNGKRDFEEVRIRNEFESLPGWLKNMPGEKSKAFPWLPVPVGELNSREIASISRYNQDNDNEDDLVDTPRPAGEDLMSETNDALVDPKVLAIAEDLKVRVLNFVSTSRTMALANEIRGLCLNNPPDPLAILELIEPWKADDETTAILISNIASQGDELSWPSRVICSFVLPKVLLLETPASRVLLTSVVQFCKTHQGAAEYGLVLPLILRKDGINNHIREIISRIVKECLHPAHVSAICRKLFCGKKEEKHFFCLPCHRCFISDELVCTESVFVLLQSIMDHNVNLTQDCIGEIVVKVQALSRKFSKSLKFGNFLLCLVTKCSSSLVHHKMALIDAVECTDTLVTKTILSKLSCL